MSFALVKAYIAFRLRMLRAEVDKARLARVARNGSNSVTITVTWCDPKEVKCAH